jgi:hypothetical protein
MIYLCVILAALLIHVRASQAAIVSSQNDTRTISVIAVDGLSSAVVTGLTMTLWDTSDPATPIWLGRATTNELGKVDFRSSQLNESNTTSLRVTTKYFNGRKFTSNTFSGETPFTFKIGTFRAEISDGSHKESPPLSHTKIGLVRFSPATLRDEWIATYHTDQAGILIANLPTFDDGYIYKLASVNNDSQELSYSPIIQSSGEYALAIGSLPASRR